MKVNVDGDGDDDEASKIQAETTMDSLREFSLHIPSNQNVNARVLKA
jgi:hypothetical protein